MSFKKVLFQNTKRETVDLEIKQKEISHALGPVRFAQGRAFARNDRNSVGMTKKNCSGGVRA